MKRFADVVMTMFIVQSFGLILLFGCFILQQTLLLKTEIPWQVPLAITFLSWFVCTTWLTAKVCDKEGWKDSKPAALATLWLTSPIPLGLFFYATAFAALAGMSV